MRRTDVPLSSHLAVTALNLFFERLIPGQGTMRSVPDILPSHNWLGNVKNIPDPSYYAEEEFIRHHEGGSGCMLASVSLRPTPGPWISLNIPFLKGEAAPLTVLSWILMFNEEILQSVLQSALATVCTWQVEACSARVGEAVWRREGDGQIKHLCKTFEIDKLWRGDPLLLCRFQDDILKGVFSTDPVSAVKYFGVGETVWVCSQTSTHSLIKPPSAHAVQSDLLSVMLGRNERMTTICLPPFFFD